MPRRQRISPKPDGALWADEFAARIGVKRPTLTNWRSTGRPVGNPVPEPDGHEPDVRGMLRPWWHPTTVDAWEARRPGGRA